MRTNPYPQTASWGQLAFALCFIIPVFSPADYWSDSFDEEANCKQPDVIGTLKAKDQCASSVTGNDTQAAFVDCKVKLTTKLVLACADTKIKAGGDLLYCKSRSTTDCCFNKQTCEDSWEEINKNFGETAVEYLTDKEKFLQKIEKLGYQKCYPIEGYDASKCAEDCKKAENEEFAKNCTSKGGFFKCCVRRDKLDCHQCRFCCSLPVCAMNSSQGVQHAPMKVIEEKDQEHKISAIESFNVNRPMYKAKDYRCLKPDTGKPPAEWPHYVMEEFRRALTKEELEKVATIEFDKNFLNFEDPEVLEKHIGPDYEKLWKETYGFDHLAKKGELAKDAGVVPEHCVKSEFSKFAKKCKKEKGFYKCCVTEFNLAVFDRIRLDLDKKKLAEAPKKLPCGTEDAENQCTIFGAAHACTKKDPLSGKLTTEFETPTQPKYKIGGIPLEDTNWSGLRTLFCKNFMTCQGVQNWQ